MSENNLPGRKGEYNLGGPPDEDPTRPRRHVILSGLLVIGIAIDIVLGFYYALNYSALHARLPYMTPIIEGFYFASCSFGVVFRVALLEWRRWGFYGILINEVLTSSVFVAIGVDPVRMLPSMLGLCILYGLLNVDGDRSAWRHLK